MNTPHRVNQFLPDSTESKLTYINPTTGETGGMRVSAVCAAAFLMIASLGCSNDPGRQGRPAIDEDSGSETKMDTGVSDDAAPSQDTVTDTGDEEGDVSEGDAGDAGDVDTGEPGPPPTEAQQLCASGGTAQGGGYTLIQCTSPVDLSGESMEGGDYQLQPGAFRVISE